ncbi:MAG: SIR2 family protein [Clostridia bacterium]|nr:SIR2 family protein [Clostridia bacterium]
MCNFDWREDPVFWDLCDMVAKGNMICLTGAGISKELKNVYGEQLPDWYTLVSRIYKTMKDNPSIHFSDEDEKIISDLLDEHGNDELQEFSDLMKSLSDGNSSSLSERDRSLIKTVLDRKMLPTKQPCSGDELVTASSKLRKIDHKLFDEILSKLVTTAGQKTTETHKAITKLNPKGIMTYNYDTAHEEAWKQEKVKYDMVIPSSKNEICNLLRNGFHNHPFILKAHGSTDKKGSLVLTSESYSELFTKYSYYKPLVQDILMNHQLLIIGFGMTDPDFDRMIQDLFTAFGSPIQTHIVITHENNKSKKDILYQEKYGFRYLYVKDFSHIPQILKECTELPGPYVKQILKEIVSGGEDEKGVEFRAAAHEKLKKLNNVAKEIVARELKEEIKKAPLQNSDEYKLLKLDEKVYSFGFLLDESIDKDGSRKEFLIKEVIEKNHDPKVVCHALYQIVKYLKKNDLPRIKRWRECFEKETYFTDYGFCDTPLEYMGVDGRREKTSRNVIYCKFLEALVYSKFYLR